MNEDAPEFRRLLLEVEQRVEQETQRLRQEGRLEGRQEGRLEGERQALKRVLSRRGLVLSDEQRARVEACVEVAELERWLDQALTARSAEEALR